MLSDRTSKTEARYQKDMLEKTAKGLHDEPIKRYLNDSWSIKANNYPYDRIWERHDMLVYSGYSTWYDMPRSDMEMFMDILPDLLKEYDAVRINGDTLQTVKNIPHVHLFKGRK